MAFMDCLNLELGESQPHVRIIWSAFVDFLNSVCGYSEPLLWIQLVAEGSLSNWRALDVAMARARQNNVERSVIQLKQRNESVESKKNAKAFEAFLVLSFNVVIHGTVENDSCLELAYLEETIIPFNLTGRGIDSFRKRRQGCPFPAEAKFSPCCLRSYRIIWIQRCEISINWIYRFHL